MAPLIETVANSTARGWGAFVGGIRFIIDTFVRTATTAPNLGVSTGGQPWTTLSGNWSDNGSTAVNTDAASGYPIAAFDVGSENQLAYANVSPGMGAAIWVSAANSFWAAYSYNSDTPYSCSCTTGANCTYCGTKPTTSYTCNGTECGYDTFQQACGQADGSGCATTAVDNATGCTGNFSGVGPTETGGCGVGYPCMYSAPSSCSTGGGCYSCTYNCTTCYTYNYYLALINNLGGAITSYGSVTLSADAAAVAIQVAGNVISYAAYSASLSGPQTTLPTANKTGSGTYTASSPMKSTRVGIMKAPSNYTQGTKIGGFYGTGQ